MERHNLISRCTTSTRRAGTKPLQCGKHQAPSHAGSIQRALPRHGCFWKAAAFHRSRTPPHASRAQQLCCAQQWCRHHWGTDTPPTQPAAVTPPTPPERFCLPTPQCMVPIRGAHGGEVTATSAVSPAQHSRLSPRASPAPHGETNTATRDTWRENRGRLSQYYFK